MTESKRPAVLLIGCGHMGGALWSGWLTQGLAPSIVIDRHLDAVPAPHQLYRRAGDMPADFRPDVIVLAIKPARMEEALAEIAPWVGQAIVISVLAGRNVADMRAALPLSGQTNPIVRAMPNTPSEIGMGVTGAFASDLTPAQKSTCDMLLGTVGKVVWVSREEEIALLTPLSGSGPAYIFLFAELLEQVACAHGFSADVAKILAQRTVSGAGALLEASGTESATLRRNVTSPNGVTAAALEVFMRESHGLKQLIEEAISAGLRRTETLGATSGTAAP